jgi:hypothetical protein
MSNRFSRPRLFVAAGALLLLIVAGDLFFLNSKSHRAAVNARASQHFGEALERSGIPSQTGPSM